MAYEPPQTSEQTPEGDTDSLPEESIEPRDTGIRYQVSGARGQEPPDTRHPTPDTKSADPGDYSTLPRSYLTVLTKPRPETYLAEIPNAGWGKTLMGVALVTLVSFAMKMLLTSRSLDQVNEFKQSLARQGQDPTIEPWRTAVQWLEGFTGPLPALIVPLTFFGGSALLYMLARAVKTKGAGTGEGASFMTHSYLLSLSYTPLHIISTLATVLSLFPQDVAVICLTVIISLGATLYQLYGAGVSMQASQKLEPGKAQMVAFVPWILGVILSICVLVLAAISFGRALINP